MLRKSLLALALLAALQEAVASEPATDTGADAAPAADTAQAMEVISVIGEGETRQVQRISADSEKLLPPGSSPLKVLSELPGVSFQSADAFGSYEWSTRISLRGFNQNRLGFTLDDIPLGDMSYGNNNGLHISRALIGENLGGAEVAEGIGGLNTASTSNLGGTVKFYSADPLPQFGVTLARTLGDDSAQRTYVRIDTGDHHGFAMYVSGAYSDTDKWKGEGEQKQTQFNVKAMYDFGDNHLGFLWTTSRRDENDYQDLSLDLENRKGWDWDNTRPNWQQAVNSAYCNPGYGHASQCPYTQDELAHGAYDWAYYDARGLRNDDLLGLSGDFGLAENLRLKATAYYHNDRGQGHWFTPYVPSSASVPISLRTTEYGIDRDGVVAALTYELGMHTLEGGLWYEDSHHTAQRNYYFINGPVDDNYFFHDPDIRQFFQRFHTETRQFYLQDTMRLLDDKLTINVGFKSPHTETTATVPQGTFAQQLANGSLTAKKTVLPQIGAGYKLGGGNELFASYGENIAAFQAGVTGPFATTQDIFNAVSTHLKPEKSKTAEGGFRHVDSEFEFSGTLYHVDFSNRLVAIAQCPGIVGCVSAFANVGSVTSQGAELAFVWKPIEGLRWYNTLSYTDATYDDDYVQQHKNDAGDLVNVIVPAKDKQTVDTPKQLFSTDLSWTQGPYELHLGANYVGKRYYTYTNDAGVPSYWLINAGAAYTFGDLGYLKNLRIALNVTNVADKHYFATVGSNGFTDSDPNGLFQTLLAGAPRQSFLTVTAKF
ncbi:MAG TPA: TonB-dependent receptor [Dokdonella sp.]